VTFKLGRQEKMKLFHTTASHFVRKCTVTIRELGLEEQVEIVTTSWPHSWGTETVPFRQDFVDTSPIARIPALLTDDGERLTESSLICEYLNDELGDYRLCPQRGRERWRILSVMSVATSGVMESQVMRRAEMLRKREESQNKQEFSLGFVHKMMDRQDRCYRRLDELCLEFDREIDLGQIACGCACAVSDFRFPEDDWRGIAPNLARWYDKFRMRPSMVATQPTETPTKPDVAEPARKRAASSREGAASDAAAAS
jgi:glutathione S-transferase